VIRNTPDLRSDVNGQSVLPDSIAAYLAHFVAEVEFLAVFEGGHDEKFLVADGLVDAGHVLEQVEQFVQLVLVEFILVFHVGELFEVFVDSFKGVFYSDR
jgi:hypothetical protein